MLAVRTSTKSERRLLLLLNGSHGGGGSGMTLLGSAQHQRLINPSHECQSHRYSGHWINERTGEDG